MSLLAVGLTLGLGASKMTAQRPAPGKMVQLPAAAAAGPAPTNVIVTGTPSTAQLRWDDRAIGILRSGLNDLVLPNAMVVLTREIIEAGLAPLPPGTPPVGLPMAWPWMPKPGVIMVPFIDGTHYIGAIAVTPARYELYLSVERLP